LVKAKEHIKYEKILELSRYISNNLNKPIGIITPLDFTRYEEYSNDEEKDNIEKILEYYI
jgi:hypothetical protein